MPLHVAVDCRMIYHSGIGTYIRSLLGGIGECAEDTHPELSLLGAPTDYAPPANLSPNLHRVVYDAKIYSLREQLCATPIPAAAQLAHFPHYNVPMRTGGVPFTVVIHDVIHLAYPGALSPAKRIVAQWMMKRAATRAAHVITVSEFSRKDIIKHLGVAPEKITVIDNALEADFRPLESPDAVQTVLRKFNVSQPYFLAVGSDKPHKNLALAVEAYEQFADAQTLAGVAFPQLAVVGISPTGPIAQRISRSPQKANITLVPYTNSRPDFATLLANAVAMIFPSHYEGFGLPILEAQAVGTPVLCSAATALPDVAGMQGALFFPPTSADILCRSMLEITRNPELIHTLRHNGQLNMRRFSWKTTAEQTLALWHRFCA